MRYYPFKGIDRRAPAGVEPVTSSAPSLNVSNVLLMRLVVARVEEVLGSISKVYL